MTYGEKRGKTAGLQRSHAALLAPSVSELSELEHTAQNSFLSLQLSGLK